MSLNKDTQAIAEAITKVISNAIFAMKVSGLEQEDLDHFRDYSRQQDTLMPLLDPTAYRDMLQNDGFERIAARLKMLEDLLKLTDIEMKHFGK